MKLNLKEVASNAGSGEFELLPEGRYNVQIESVAEKTSQAGNPVLEVTFRIPEGKFENRKLWDNLSLQPKALVYLVNLLKAAGLEEMLEEDVDTSEIKRAMVGQYVSGFVAQKSNPVSGKTRNVISQYTPVSDDFGTPAVAPPPKPANKRKLFD